MNNKMVENTKVFYRLVKAPKGHKFAGLYAVEEVYIKDNTIYKKAIVKEWDLRIISEACLARLGGASAYKAFTEDNEVIDPDPIVAVVDPRTPEELKGLTKNKLTRELKLPKDKGE